MKCVSCKKRKPSGEFPPESMTCKKCLGGDPPIRLPTRSDKARNRRFLKGWS